MSLRAIIKGFTGELKTTFVQKLFLDEEYRIFNNVLIPTESRSTQIDHIIVSKYGVFVIETKDKTGWIFGDPKEAQWTQVIFNDRYRFQNPIRQNYLHTKSLAEFLRIDHKVIHSLIIFWGDCEFKTPMPEYVFKGNVFNTKYTNYIKSKNKTILSENEVDRICSILKEVKDSKNIFDNISHAITVNKHIQNTKCPRCGGNLVERIARKGNNIGQKFLGCEKYPKCRYIKSF